MSHLSKIELTVTDIDTLTAACNRMGFKLIKGQGSYKWFGQDKSCDHAIQIPNADYEIGVIQNNGQFELNCDFYDHQLKKAIGENGGLLKQAYAVEQTRQVARKRGYTVIERASENHIRLQIAI